MSWLPIAIEGGKALIGGIQALTNKKPKPLNYQIPSEVYNYLGTLKERADQGLPGMDTMVENVFSQGAAVTNQLKETAVSGASLQGSVNQLATSTMKGLRDIDIMNAQFKDTAKVDYARGLMEMAQYKDRQWDFNVNQPHIQAMTEYFNKKDTANQNLFGGLEGMAEYSFYNNMYGSGDGADGKVVWHNNSKGEPEPWAWDKKTGKLKKLNE